MRYGRVLLRNAFVLLVCFSAAFVLLHFARQTEWYKERVSRDLFSADPREQLRCAAHLAQLNAQKQLLAALKADNPSARRMARRALEHLWFHAAGPGAYETIQKAYRASDARQHKEALALLDALLAAHPDFAEAWNQRASVYWQMGRYDESMADCRRVLELNPQHYGAWQGLGICQLESGDLAGACESLRIALHILPHDEPTRQSLRRCEELLRGLPSQMPKLDIL